MDMGAVTLNKANIKWQQFYVSSIRNLFFPLGQHENTVFEIDIGESEPVQTVIVAEYLYFRNKAWMKQFFKKHELEVGDQIVFKKTGTHSFKVEVLKKNTPDGGRR